MVSAPIRGVVLERDGAVYRVATDDGERRAVLRGKTKRDTPKVVVGDDVSTTRPAESSRSSARRWVGAHLNGLLPCPLIVVRLIS